MHKLLMVSLSAALISVRMSGIAEAAYTERDINRMEDLISAGNWVDLRIFLLANPSVMNGNDQFTEELRKFLEETDSLYTALTFDPSIFPDLLIATPVKPAPVRTQRPDSSPRVARSDNSDTTSDPNRGPVRTRNAVRAAGSAAGSTVSIY